jgi:Fibronectin type III domain
MRRPLLSLVLCCLSIAPAGTAWASTSTSYPTSVFSDTFESGTLASWAGNSGNGSATVSSAAAHSGSDGLRLTNSSGQFDVVVKPLSAPLIDSSISFWLRVGAGSGLETIAQARDQSSSAYMWALLYDSNQHGFWFYPYAGSKSTEIFTGANTAPANTWIQVEVRYTATATGGAQLLINGQTQPSWGVSGNYARSDNLQRLQLWNDSTTVTDFDDVAVAVPSAIPTAPSAPAGVTATPGNGSATVSWSAPSSNGGSAITGYRITPYMNGTAQTPIPTGSTNTYTVTGLTNGTAYTFTVAAINNIGVSRESSPSTAVTPSPSTSVVSPMPLISQNLPALGDTGVQYDPAFGDDNNYGGGSGAYDCTPPCSLIINLSSVPVAQRQQAVVAWYNDESSYYAAAINSEYYNDPRDYTIDVSSAPGGSSPPTSWTTLVSVTGNFYNGREHFVNLNGANWLRMHVTAVNGSSGNQDASFNLDVHNASAGTSDTWLILGDSITQDDMGHYEPSNFMQQINAAYPAFYPSEINGGIGGWDSSSPLRKDPRTGQTYIDEFLASFPGHFVSLDYGTNDANEGGQAVAAFPGNMTTMINRVLAAGKVPVLRRSIPWGCTASIKTYGPTVNADLQNLLAQFPQAVAGPDEWSYFQAHQSLIAGDCIHPTIGAGNAAYRQVYVSALLNSVYAGSH